MKYYYDERYCKKCNKDTEHYCIDAEHERDSSGDSQECQICGCYVSGYGILIIPDSNWKPRKLLGLVPPSPESKIIKDTLPLEFTDKAQRKEVSDLFKKLRNVHGVRGGGIVCYDKNICKARDLAIMALAKQLLGEDWECEILC